MMDKRWVGGSEYHTKKVLDVIEEYSIQMEFLIDITSSSNSALVSNSEG